MTIDQLETPALCVDLDILESNLARMAAYVAEHGLKLRPHTKTHKIPEIAQMQVAFGAHGVTVAKISEAEVMAAGGLDNILLAYPAFGERKLARLASLARSTKITVAIDNMATVEAISRAACNAGSEINLLVEVDVGMRRCGVATAQDVVALAEHIGHQAGVRFAGLNLYPGQIWAPPHEQEKSLREVGEAVRSTRHALSERGIVCDVVSGGSTPTAFQSHFVESLTEIRPGTYVFNDRNTLGAGACSLDECALRVLVTVVSTAVPGYAVFDGGTKTLSSDRWLSGSREGFGYVVEDPSLLIEHLSEEHGQVNLAASASTPRIGDRLSIIPNHVCACVNLHNSIWYHRKGVVEGFWTVKARGCVI